jgi:hydroxymethylpyrimidine pyrophosphatase-like HAD family hydrolase
MINGVKEAKDAADYVTEYDNNENGVYHFLVNQL